MAKQSVAKQSVKSTAKSLSPKSPSRTKIGGARPKPSSKKGLRVQGQQYVGIELHRRRSVIVRLNDASEVLGVTKVANDPAADVNGHRRERPRPRGGPGSLLRGWYWAAHLLRPRGARCTCPPPRPALGQPAWTRPGGRSSTTALFWSTSVATPTPRTGQMVRDDIAVKSTKSTAISALSGGVGHAHGADLGPRGVRCGNLHNGSPDLWGEYSRSRLAQFPRCYAFRFIEPERLLQSLALFRIWFPRGADAQAP